MKKIFKNEWITLPLICVLAPVTIGFLARLNGAYPILLLLAIPIFVVIFVVVKFILWLDKKVGPTDF
jgi:hypothetical protein